MRWMLLFPFSRWWNWDTKRLCNWPKSLSYPGLGPRQSSPRAYAFNHMFLPLSALQASMKGCWGVMKTSPKGMRHQYLNRIMHFDFMLKFQFLHLLDFGLKDSCLLVEIGVGQIFMLPNGSRRVCATVYRLLNPWKQRRQYNSQC